ncbi:Transcriptional regulatory protein, C terminal [Nocardioides terrae]|uniref:Transcriptional regulatory protein, C terminal n=1 Tax=Nocardioides terrae TaxID=574651 RepID=A0A1I1DGU1_9ACTN|nr:BTAD domain-containing putative transcriptional regulator [Nocardioides terrae]SFB72278.1 Transcriptional regulatory protein, C terminal [Nocardioides terrae]
MTTTTPGTVTQTVSASVLGQMEVALDGVPVDLGTPKQRALVAALALSRGRAVSVDGIVDLLWGDTPPNGVSATLQAYVSQLRRVLEPARQRRTPATVLVTVAPGYALQVAPGGLDAARFEAAVMQTHGVLQGLDLTGPPRLTSAELTGVVGTLDGALALWRGEPYADLGDAAAAVAERARLEELRLVALEDRAVARLALGQHATVAAELEALTSAHPLRERLWALRTLALTRAGRQAEALDALRRVRELLDEELGLEPSADLRDLQTAVLRQDPALEWTPPAAQPAAVPAPAPATVPAPAPATAPASLAVPAPRAEPPVDLPTGPAAVAPWPLCGREAELEALVALLDRSVSGRASCAVLTGEPGIGKSRLAAELAARARARGVRVLRGRCSQDDGAPPLWPWRAVLERLGTELSEADGEDVGAAFRVWDRICAEVLRATEEGPVLLVLDDLHWADASSLRVLRLLAETAPAATPLLVIATWRSHPAPDGLLADVAEALARQHPLRLELTGLEPGAVGELFAAVSERELADDSAEVLQERTDGNPFFLVEYARLAASRHDANVPERPPTAVAEVLRRRIERLPAETVSTLRFAALIGRRFDVPTLAAASGRDEDDILDLVEPAVVAGLVREDGIDRFAFGHALVRDTLRSNVAASRLARAHAAVARALEGRPERETEVARHWLAAGPSHASRAWRAAVAAAAGARRLHAYDEAADLLRVALDVMPGDPEATLRDRYDTLMDLVEAYRWAALLPSLVGCAEEAIDVARRMRDPEAVARAATSATQSSLWRSAPPGEVNGTVVAALRGSLERLPEGDGELRCRTLLALANELAEQTTFAERAALVDEATAMARRLGDPRLVIDTCLVGFVALWTAWTAGDRLDRVTRAMELARHIGDEREFLVAATLRAAVLGELGRPTEMFEAAEVARSEARRLRIGYAEGVLHGLEVPWLAMRGEFEECERRLADLRTLRRRLAHTDMDENVAACLLALRLWQGRAAEVIPVLRGLDTDRGEWAPTIAVYHWRAGLYDEARWHHRQAGAPITEDTEVPLHTVAHAAELSLYLADADLAQRCARRLTNYSGMAVSLGSSMALGPVDLYLACAAAAAGDAEAAHRDADAALDRAREWGLDALIAWFEGVRSTYGF